MSVRTRVRPDSCSSGLISPWIRILPRHRLLVMRRSCRSNLAVAKAGGGYRRFGSVVRGAAQERATARRGSKRRISRCHALLPDGALRDRTRCGIRLGGTAIRAGHVQRLPGETTQAQRPGPAHAILIPVSLSRGLIALERIRAVVQAFVLKDPGLGFRHGLETQHRVPRAVVSHDTYVEAGAISRWDNCICCHRSIIAIAGQVCTPRRRLSLRV